MAIYVDQKGVVKINFINCRNVYECSGNDALILNKYANANLIQPGAQVRIKEDYLKCVLSILDFYSISYDVYKDKKKIMNKRFKPSRYEVIDRNNYHGEYYLDENDEPIIKDSLKKRRLYYDSVYLSKFEDPYSHTPIIGLSPNTILDLIKLKNMLDKKVNKTKENRTINSKAPEWTEEEDRELLKEYNENRNIKELSKIHKRKQISIRARLKRMGVDIEVNSSHRNK